MQIYFQKDVLPKQTSSFHGGMELSEMTSGNREVRDPVLRFEPTPMT